MKFITLKENLKEMLSVVGRVSGGNSHLPILKNFLIEATDYEIKCTGTNLEVGVVYSITGKVIEKGKTTIPTNIFSNIINNIQTERLNIESKGTTTTLTTDNYKATLQGLLSEDFPLIPKIKNQLGQLTIPVKSFLEALHQVVVASQLSEFRPELNTILFDFSLDAIRFVATDSFRLAEKTIQKNAFQTTYTEAFKILIPLTTIHELLGMLKGEDSVTLTHDHHQILFKTKHIEFISRLVEGNFPEYSSLIPQSFKSEMVFQREEFLQAIKLVGIFGSQVHEIHLKTHENKKAIEIHSADTSLGENNYILPGKITGEIKETSFNWRYLGDGLKALSTEEIYLGINEDNKPSLIKAPNDASYFYILMPIIKA